jgi:acyl-CoA hydrolase
VASLLPCSAWNFARVLAPGDHITWPQGTGEPTGLTARLLAQAAALPRFTLVLGMVTSRTLDNPNAERCDFICLNGAANSRKATALSGNRVIPSHVSAIPGLIASRKLRVDVALVRVRPSADPNMLSLGVMVDFVHEMIDAARVVIGEYDERMPLTAGDTLVPKSKVTHLVLADCAEQEIADGKPSEIDLTVAKRVAEIVPDRATIQLGVGALPVAVCRALSTHRDLGLHSGVLPDAAVDLIEAGIVTNRFKGIDEGMSVTGGLFGTRKLFDFAHHNPEMCLRRARYTHVPATLAQLNALHTVNSAIAVDLSGQINAEVAGSQYVGAVGGQVDFVRGGRLSPGGRSIIALTSTTPDGKHSKIVANLNGQPVTTARSDVDTVVTEYGRAELWGLDLPARARALIAIAHPRFRDELMRST